MSTRRTTKARSSAVKKRAYTTRKPAMVRRSATRRVSTRATKAGASDNSVGSALGSALGGMIGGPAGMGIGSALGRGAQGLFRAITGVGDYKVSSNSLMAGPGVAVDSLPKFSNSGRGVRLTHREYIQDITTGSVAGAFNLTKVVIQPALTLPWASSVAQQFQEYKIHGMIFEFKSTSSDALNSTNTALGTVVMATQYNVLTPDYTNKQQMDQSEFSCSAKPSQSIIHPIECARGESMLNVLSTRNGPAPTSSSDLRLYDFGNFYIATAGGQAASVTVGELWCSYDIELLKPALGAAADEADVYVLGAGIAVTTNYFGTTLPAKSASSDLGTTLTNTTITFPSSFTGQVQLTYIVGGTAATVQGPTVTPSAGATALNMFANYANSNIGPGGTYSAGNMISSYTFSCVGGGLLTFSGGQFPTATTQGTLIINVLPSTLRASLT